VGAHECAHAHLKVLLVQVELVVGYDLVEETEAAYHLAVRHLGRSLTLWRLDSALLQLDHGIAPHDGLLVKDGHWSYILNGLLLLLWL